MPVLVRIIVASALLAAPCSALAETVILNHLDCYFDETAQSMKCPEVDPVQTGRSSNGAEAPKPAIAPRPKMARCTTYKTYDPARGTYRGYDGVTHACR